ncbi:MAG: VCBS repeat-containing protein, partial [Gemmatimonadetes bacterium]|nr:VCBS repeat-containing protein [Gemmatimonadota bacterium]
MPETRDSKFRFAHHLIDTDLEGVYWGQTALADLDGDGRLEFIMGRWRGELLWYKYHTPDQWTRHLLHPEALSDVGLCVLDVDGDGHLDVVSGGGWYRNTQDPNSPFERFVYDPELDGSHDIMAADIDGDGRMEVVTMSDRNSLRWYRIPDDPTRPWEMHFVGPAVHAGATIGDVDSDGDLDIVRTNVWFENIDGDGSRWAVH